MSQNVYRAIKHARNCTNLCFKCKNFAGDWGSAPEAAGIAYNASPDPLVGWGGGTSPDRTFHSILAPQTFIKLDAYDPPHTTHDPYVLVATIKPIPPSFFIHSKPEK